MSEFEEFDKLKTKVLKYVLYKKRTELEVKQKFASSPENIGAIIEYLKENDYINDEKYIERAVNEFINLNNLSIKEIQYKLMSKGISKDKIENYITNNKEKLLEYEEKSKKQIYRKKQNIMTEEEISIYLKKKGYLFE